MRRQLAPAVALLAAFTVLTGLAYPLVVTGLAQGIFSDQAEGSLVTDAAGELLGSELLGQPFGSVEYFHPRPSAAGEGDGYAAADSSGSNLGPTNPELITAVEDRVLAYRELNGLALDTEVPVDAVTASGSGLDPHISVANARLQAPRVAEARGLSPADVLDLVSDHTDERGLGFLGEAGVDVLQLNLALDELPGR